MAKKRTKHLSQNTKKLLGYGMMFLCGFLSVYIFAASYETTFSADLPIVNSVSKVTTPPVSRLLETGSKTNQLDSGNYGKPAVLKIPSHNSKIVLAPQIDRSGILLARANTAHYTLLSSPKNGNLGNIFVYFMTSWRTDSHIETLKAGDNLFIDTDRDWRYFFRVDSTKDVDKTQTFVMREAVASQLIVAAQKSDSSSLFVIEASLVNVQNVRQ